MQQWRDEMAVTMPIEISGKPVESGYSSEGGLFKVFYTMNSVLFVF